MPTGPREARGTSSVATAYALVFALEALGFAAALVLALGISFGRKAGPRTQAAEGVVPAAR